MAAQPEEVTPEQIRERMADTRAAVETHLDRLREEASPRAILARRLPGGRNHSGAGRSSSRQSAARQSAVPGIVGRLRHQVTQRPILVAVAAIAVGVAVAVLVPGPRSKRP